MSYDTETFTQCPYCYTREGIYKSDATVFGCRGVQLNIQKNKMFDFGRVCLTNDALVKLIDSLTNEVEQRAAREAQTKRRTARLNNTLNEYYSAKESKARQAIVQAKRKAAIKERQQ
jgi:hypothetical protein